MAFQPDEYDYDESINDLPDLSFDMSKFIEEVFNNMYILIIGSEVILDTKVEPSGDINRYLLRHVNKRLKSNYENFNELFLHSNEMIDPIRNLLSKEKFKKEMEIGDISEELRNLLRTKLFKVVITTTFDSYLEMLMRDIWDDKDDKLLNVVNIWDAESLSNFQKRLTKYPDPKDYNEPTLIYAFGKCEEKVDMKYARIDFDYIQAIERWMSFDARSDKMMQFIQSKRLLSLGCKFDDWYFRFFWYILKREKDKQREGEIAIVFDENDRSEKNLKTYLFNARVFTHPQEKTDGEKDPTRKFMQDIHNALTSLDDNNSYRDQVLKLRRRGVIFFSYCNRDKKIARELFLKLQSLYPNLWFDDEKILCGDNYEKEILNGIKNAKVFVLLLTPSVAEDLTNNITDNFYNGEWRIALEKGKMIIPLATEGFSLKEDYRKTFENIIGYPISIIETKETNWFNKLLNDIDENLKK